MVNALYPLGKQAFLNGDLDWSTATIKVALVRSYTFDAADEFVSDVTTAGGELVAVSSGLANKGSALGVADGDDIVYPSVPPGAAITSIVGFQASAVTGGADVPANQQLLIFFIDTGTNLPIVPNSGDLTIQWAELASKIFAL